MESMDKEQIDKELLPFLSIEARGDLKAIALDYFLGLTGTSEGQRFIANNNKYLEAIVSLSGDSQSFFVKKAYISLVNLSGDSDIAWQLLNLPEKTDFLSNSISYVVQQDSEHADIVCMLLANLSRGEKSVQKIVETIIKKSDEIGFDRITQAFCLQDYNKHAGLHFLGPFLANLTQMKEARAFIMDRERCVIQRLLPYTQYDESVVRRRGIVTALRNCCFDTEFHEWLLGNQVDILPRLLLPLAGPEEFDDDDMEKLPDDLQYLEPDKTREQEPDIRKMLVEALTQLCSTKTGRTFIKEKNAYIIMRELFEWEKVEENSDIIEQVVQILIGDEPEEGMENLKEIQIPEDIQNKFKQLDAKKLEQELSKHSI